MGRLPECIDGCRIFLRRWLVSDAERLGRALTESGEHLRPWMAWMADEPQTLKRRREMLADWEQKWGAGQDTNYAVLVDEEVAGSCGLHRRLGPGTLEIGYWIHVSFLGRGLATKAAALLTDAAFTFPDIARVEIHHDKANLASERVPRRLGYGLVGEQSDSSAAPGETGVGRIWRMQRSQWANAPGRTRKQHESIRFAARP